MRLIELDEPRIEGQAVVVSWRVDPDTTLCQPTTFALRFPSSVDLARVPREVLWIAALSCLHMQFVLLRPCTVRLPVTLPSGWAESWLRLMDAAVATLEYYRGTNENARSIRIEENGPRMPQSPPLAAGDRCGTAFSSGKDSLLQAGILSELTERPLLVTVTSPRPPYVDHITSRRRFILEEIPRRRDVELIEVVTELRGSWNNMYAAEIGYPVGINEICDTHLYFSCLLITAVAKGVTHLFLASELEVQENIEHRGRVIQHAHFMYSAATQRAIAAFLDPLGLSYSSLTWPLWSGQVQELLWTRYPDIADLQYSCWLVSEGKRMCGECPQCLRLALVALRLGRSPAAMGIDFAGLMRAQGQWTAEVPRDHIRPLSPRELTGGNLNRQMVRTIREVTPLRAARALLRERPRAALEPETWRALASYIRLRYNAGAIETGPAPGYRPGFLTDDPVVAPRLRAVYDGAFPADPPAAYAAILERSRRLPEWVSEPLRASPPAPRTPLVSIIIPMMDRAADLETSLPSLLAQEYPAFEVCVVDMGSRDNLDKILTRYASSRLRCIRAARPAYFSYARARNLGIQAATGELLLFWNGDDTFTSITALADAVRSLTTAAPGAGDPRWFANWRESCGYPTLDAPPAAPPLEHALPAVYSHDRGSLLLVERAPVVTLGGYNEWLEDWGYEDTDLLARLENAGYARLQMESTGSADAGDELRTRLMRNKDRDATWERNRRISDACIAVLGSVAPPPDPKAIDPDLLATIRSIRAEYA